MPNAAPDTCVCTCVVQVVYTCVFMSYISIGDVCAQIPVCACDTCMSLQRCEDPGHNAGGRDSGGQAGPSAPPGSGPGSRVAGLVGTERVRQT